MQVHVSGGGTSNANLGLGLYSDANSAYTFKVTNGGKAHVKDGILFGTDTADANKMDDYEEGTFTPTITDGSTACGSYHTNNGWYTKVGSLVTAQIRLRDANTTGLTSTNTMYVEGLPFSMATATGRIQVGTVELDNFNLDSNTRSLSTFSNISSGSVTRFRVFQSRDSEGHLALTVAAIVSNTDNELNASITYCAA